MSLAFSVSINDRATPIIERLTEGLRDMESLNRAAAEGMLPVVQRNFVELVGSNRNSFGVRGGFWARMNAGTTAHADESGGAIRMPREVALRLFGGTVTPQQKEFLPIPLRSEAYGKSPREFNDLHFVPISGDRGMLVQNEQTQIGKRGKSAVGGGAFYILVRSATIDPNPDVLPDDEALGAGAVRGIKSLVRTLLGREGGTN